MADELDDLLAARASGAQVADDIDMDLALKAGPAAAAEPKEQATTWADRIKSLKMGAMDPVVGAGQLIQNVLPEAASEFLRKPGSEAFNVIPGVQGAQALLRSVGTPGATTESVNQDIRAREAEHQAARQESGQEGMDWWRIGGTVANPISWLGPSGAGSVIAAGAKTGAFQALLQPVTTEGNFLWDKAQQAAFGGVVGGTLAGAVGLIQKPLAAGFRYLKGSLSGADDAAKAMAADKVLDDTLKAAKVDPQKMDRALYGSLRQEVHDALKAGIDPDPTVITNRADAAALPVPMRLSRAEASRDPMQFAWEHRVSGMQNAGEALAAHKTEGNKLLIQNLNALGADTAPSQFDAANSLIGRIKSIDAGLKSNIDKAYAAVRDSAGRPAKMDHISFVDRANDAIDQGQLGPYLPASVRQQLNDIAGGKLPLTVNVAQQLDKVWGAAQRGTQDGSAKMAIGELRRALNEAPIADALGQESMQAYQAARKMAAQRFGLIDANPAYAAVLDDVAPDKFFQKYVVGANVRDLKGLKDLVGPEQTKMLQQTLIGNLKRTALNNSSDEMGNFSQSAYNRVLQDPVQMPRLRELFADDVKTLDQLYRVGRVAAMREKPPAASRVNYSNTAANNANVLSDLAKNELGDALWSMSRLGGVRQIMKEAKARGEMAKGISDALNPGVTAAPLPKQVTNASSRRLSELAARGGATAYAIDEREE